MEHGSETMGDKLHSREGNSPDLQPRSLNMTKWERRWDFTDNQEVGLEAATLERVRNSSLVEWSCADNVAGLKHNTEAADLTLCSDFFSGRGSRRVGW